MGEQHGGQDGGCRGLRANEGISQEVRVGENGVTYKPGVSLMTIHHIVVLSVFF